MQRFRGGLVFKAHRLLYHSPRAQRRRANGRWHATLSRLLLSVLDTPNSAHSRRELISLGGHRASSDDGRPRDGARPSHGYFFLYRSGVKKIRITINLLASLGRVVTARAAMEGGGAAPPSQRFVTVLDTPVTVLDTTVTVLDTPNSAHSPREQR